MTGKAATWQRWLEPRQSRGRAWVLPVLLLNNARKCLDAAWHELRINGTYYH